MLHRMQVFFENIELREISELEELPADHIPIVSCAILLHIAFIDLSFPVSEQEAIILGTMKRANVSEEVAKQVMDLAEVIRISTPMFSLFIDILNKQLDLEQRKQLYELCWEVIKSDNKVEPAELRAATELGKKLGLTTEQEIEARRHIIDS